MGSPRTEDGFTLVELVLAILIIGVITVPLGDVVIGFLKNTDATTARLLESHDAQIASAYWAQDVASIGTRGPAPTYAPIIGSVETDVAYNSGLYPCGPAGTPNAIVRFAWDDFSGADATPQVLVPMQVRVAYVVQTVSGETGLHRLRCNGSTTVDSDVTLAHDLDPSMLPTVTCATTCTLHLTLKDPNNHNSAYVVDLSGQRRQSS